MKRFVLGLAATVASIALAPAANAAIFVDVVVDGVHLNPLPNVAVDAGTGLFTFTYANAAGNLSVQLSATGKGSNAFSAPDPQFATQALTVDATGGGSHIVSILLSQTGLTSATPGFSATNSFNTLIGTLAGSATASAYVGANTPYAMSNLIGSTLSCGSGTTCDSGAMISAIAHGTPFSETVAYNFTIASGRIQANTQIAAALPEPATWGMMLLGFGAMGGMLRTRSRKVRVRFA